jgi:putative ABC transport system permease protein
MKEKTAPTLPLRFFRWFCHPKLRDSIEGDLMELYDERLREIGKRKADLKFIGDVLLLFRPGIIKPAEGYKNLNNYGMYKSYFKVGVRNIIKHKVLSFINIAGLSAGLTCFAIIALWVDDEMSYDKFNSKYDRIVRVIGTTKTELGTFESAVTSAPMAQALKNDFPEVEDVVRLRMRGDVVKYKDQQLHQSGILLADPSFFDIFSFHLSKGNVATALSEPFSIILTESIAKKYFGESDPMGETLTVNMYDGTGYGALYKITGVMPDPPRNSHFTFTMLASFKTIEVASPEVLTTSGWGDASFYTYILLKEGVSRNEFSEKIAQFYGKYIGSLFNTWKNIYSYKLQPLSDIYLRSHLRSEIAPTGSIYQVFLFSTIGIFVLVLAGINYVNLAIASSIKRAREVGVKKVVGALKSQLIAQYVFESALTTLIALIISLLVSFLLQPLFSQLTTKNLLLFSSPTLLLFLTGVSILLGIVSGLYPAIILSGFKPLQILKGNFQQGRSGLSLRKSLILAQFAITTALVTCIIVVNSQMKFIKHKNLGYNKDALIFLRVHGNTDVINGYAAFKNELLTNPLISVVATSNTIPIGGLGSGESETVDKDGKSIQVHTARLRTDSDYIDAYGINLIAGRNFHRGLTTDTIQPVLLPVLLNETAVQTIGWESPQSAIGKPFKIGSIIGEVIGVTKDFHFSSLHNRIEPLAIYPVSERFSRITLNANVSKASAATGWIMQVWKKHFPSALLDYDFVDSQIGEQYLAEERFSKIVTYFSFTSLLIACLGLYGLISYTASQKVKEIGIRKVLGASANSITLMLSKDFFKLVIVSAFLAVPVAWYSMSRWLDNFAYRTTITWWMPTIAGLIVLILAMLTVSFQAIKAALKNPVESLKSE